MHICGMRISNQIGFALPSAHWSAVLTKYVQAPNLPKMLHHFPWKILVESLKNIFSDSTYSVTILSHLIALSSWLLPACQILSNCRVFSASLSSQAWVSTFAQKVQQRPHAQSYHLHIWKLHIYPFRLGPRGWYRMVCPRCTSYKMNPTFTDVSLYYPWGIRFCNKNFKGDI